jgi:hypothetical protein
MVFRKHISFSNGPQIDKIRNRWCGRSCMSINEINVQMWAKNSDVKETKAHISTDMKYFIFLGQLYLMLSDVVC